MNHPSSLSIFRILHAGYIFKTSKASIIFDPIFENPFSVNCYAYPNVQFDNDKISKLYFDAIFISHYHDDHCSFDSLKYLNRDTPIYLYCIFDEMFEWLRELGFKKVFSLSIGDRIEVGDQLVKVWPALDPEVDCIFEIQSSGVRVLNIVDSWINPDSLPSLCRKEERWDLVLWPFQTMQELAVLSPRWAAEAMQSLPAEWLSQIKELNPKAIIAGSCQFQFEKDSWKNSLFFPIQYAQFHREVAEALPGAKVLQLQPGRALQFFDPGDGNIMIESDGSEHLEWVIQKEKSEIDYNYKRSCLIPTTAQIAMTLPENTFEEAQRVQQYLREQLLLDYNRLQAHPESHSYDRVLWSLQVFDKSGQASEFQFFIEEGMMKELKASLHSAASCSRWLTQIPLCKLYSALFEGESLNSIEVRINDFLDVHSDSEKEFFNTCDVLWDPLIRCLYEGKFGQYQKNQLDRIKKAASSID